MPINHHTVAALIAPLVDFSQRHRYLVLLVGLVLSWLSASYTASHIGINTNTAEMLSERLPWRQAYNDYQQAFPFFTDTIVVVVDAATPDLAAEAAALLSSRLAEDNVHIQAVVHPGNSPFMRQHQLLYASVPELEELSDRLSSAQALLGQLAQKPNVDGLLDLLSELHRREQPIDGLDVESFIASVTGAFDEFLLGEATPMSWQRLLLGGEDSSPSRVVFALKPVLDFSTLLPGENAIVAIRSTIDALGYNARLANPANPAVSVRLTGAAALADDELASVIRGAGNAGMLALGLVALSLIIGLRSASLVIATLVNLAAGLLFTACFATVAVGTLNMISVAFAVLYVGLGVDFAIHLGLRYRELCERHQPTDALRAAAVHIGPSLALCALTTAIAFFAFIPTAYRGVAELGLISGVGMAIGLITSLTLLPALLEILPAPRPPSGPGPGLAALGKTRGYRRGVLWLTAGLTVVAVALLPRASFDLNPLHLNDPHAESVTTLADLAGGRGDPLHTIALIADNAAAAERLSDALSALPTVSEVRHAGALVPEQQAEKLAILEDLSWTLGDVLAPSQSAASDDPSSGASLLQRLTSLATVLQARNDLSPTALKLRAAIEALSARVAALPSDTADDFSSRLNEKLMRHFRPQLDRLDSALGAAEFGFAELPAPLRNLWIAADQRFRLEIFPAAKLDTNLALTEFVDSVRQVAGDSITSTPVINLAASRAVTAAFYQAFGTAAILIGLLLWLLLRRWQEVLVLLAPLALAGLFTAAATVVINVPFNFANIIALPLLLGIGVDSALHILHRYKTMADDQRPLHQTSTARAVLFSALTTSASFGNLAVSPHAGTASMGILLTVGLGLTLLCTLIVLPTLLERYVPNVHHANLTPNDK